MEQNRSTIDFRREDIEDARRMTVRERLEAGGNLFDAATEVTLSGILGQRLVATRAEAIEVLRCRLEWARKTETRVDG